MKHSLHWHHTSEWLILNTSDIWPEVTGIMNDNMTDPTTNPGELCNARKKAFFWGEGVLWGFKWVSAENKWWNRSNEEAGAEGQYWVLSTACVKCRMWRSAPLFSHSTSLNQSSVWWKRPKKKDLIKLWWQSGCGHDIFWGIHDSWFWWILASL